MSQVSFVMPLYGIGPRLCSIEYDLLGKATKFSLNGVALLTKVYDYDNNSVTAKYHRGEGAEDEICTEYDKYGRVKAIKHNGASALELTYEDESAAAGFEESPSCADIKTSRDECIGADYTYDYDEYTGKLTGYRVSGVGMSMHVFSAGSDKVKYEFDEGYLDYEDQITYDENCLIEPRIVKAYNNSDWGIDWNISYDKLGRVNRREEDYNFWLGECPVMEVTYKPGTGLKEQIKYSKKGYSETVSQKYDSRGNIVGITNEYSGAFTGKDEYEYSYDSLNRIVGEKVTGIISYSRTYAYDSEGNISRVTQDGEEESYEYSQGRLTRVKVNGTIKKQYSYDEYGNPVDYAGEAMEWERGTQLKSYLGQSYSYDAQGRLYGKSGGGRTWINYYDGDKLIAHKIDCNKWLIIRYFYDTEGIAGFKIGTSDKYTYAKDGQGNVVGLMSEGQIIAKYVYDAWGNCTVTGPDGEEITAWDDPAVLNPIRWKSQYYDADTGLYLIGQRWYDPETGRYISSASPESLLENAGVVYALNLYAFCAGNPLAVLIAASTFLPEFELYYNGEYKTWWEANGKWVLLGIGVAATIAACIAAPFTCGASSAVIAIGTTLAKIALGTAIGAAVSLAIGGTIAGIQGALTGHGFWQSFGESVSENFVDAVVTSFAFTAVTIAAGNIIKTRCCFKEGTLVETEEGLKPIEEIREGDLVLAYDEQTGEQAYKPVVQLFRNTTEEWQYVYIEGEAEPIISTPGHKYYLPENHTRREDGRPEEHASYAGLSERWVSACSLKKGDRVLLSDGKSGTVERTVCVKLAAPETTYNFEVADFHTYYVGNNGVLVHNTDCWNTQKKKYWKNEANELKGKDITYKATKGNIELMQKGKAPIGLDGKPVELHHVYGRGVDKIVQMQQTLHRGAGSSFHATQGFKGFPDITTLPEWNGKFV